MEDIVHGFKAIVAKLFRFTICPVKGSTDDL